MFFSVKFGTNHKVTNRKMPIFYSCFHVSRRTNPEKHLWVKLCVDLCFLISLCSFIIILYSYFLMHLRTNKPNLTGTVKLVFFLLSLVEIPNRWSYRPSWKYQADKSLFFHWSLIQTTNHLKFFNLCSVVGTFWFVFE